MSEHTTAADQHVIDANDVPNGAHEGSVDRSVPVSEPVGKTPWSDELAQRQEATRRGAEQDGQPDRELRLSSQAGLAALRSMVGIPSEHNR